MPLGAPGDYDRDPRFAAGAWRFCAVQLGGVEALLSTVQATIRDAVRGDPVQRARFAGACVAMRNAGFWVHEAARRFAMGGCGFHPRRAAGARHDGLVFLDVDCIPMRAEGGRMPTSDSVPTAPACDCCSSSARSPATSIMKATIRRFSIWTRSSATPAAFMPAGAHGRCRAGWRNSQPWAY